MPTSRAVSEGGLSTRALPVTLCSGAAFSGVSSATTGEATSAFRANAQIAQDLRREVLQLMQQGHDDAQIKQFLVARYGEFVLYQPPLQPGTWLLWGGPLLVLGAGALVVLGIVRRRGRSVGAAAAGKADEGDGW